MHFETGIYEKPRLSSFQRYQIHCITIISSLSAFTLKITGIAIFVVGVFISKFVSKTKVMQYNGMFKNDFYSPI